MHGTHRRKQPARAAAAAAAAAQRWHRLGWQRRPPPVCSPPLTPADVLHSPGALGARVSSGKTAARCWAGPSEAWGLGGAAASSEVSSNSLEWMTRGVSRSEWACGDIEREARGCLKLSLQCLCLQMSLQCPDR